VLCVDEKSQIQALDRTAPCLPMLPTTPARMTHDYVRNGTTSLFAAFDTASGSVIAQHYRRHRHQEFLRFLKLIDQAVPKDLDLHLICDLCRRNRTSESRSLAEGQIVTQLTKGRRELDLGLSDLRVTLSETRIRGERARSRLIVSEGVAVVP
jgi:hypothetical protein